MKIFQYNFYLLYSCKYPNRIRESDAFENLFTFGNFLKEPKRIVKLRRCLHISHIIPRFSLGKRKKIPYIDRFRENSEEMAVQPVGKTSSLCHVAMVAYLSACMHTCSTMVYQFRGSGRLRGGRKGDVIGAHGRIGGHRVARKFDQTRGGVLPNLNLLRGRVLCVSCDVSRKRCGTQPRKTHPSNWLFSLMAKMARTNGIRRNKLSCFTLSRLINYWTLKILIVQVRENWRDSRVYCCAMFGGVVTGDWVW